ncbi:MAG: M61 family metallopeptidase [Abyssibacter sp.]|nr:M61 family peptidase [Abyssibacter sp.]MCK5859408.1 M61 family metallopeptidase [Abyssibacter sp.]
MTPLHYRIEPAEPAAHRFHVALTIQHPDPAGQWLTLPAWIPGSYLVRDFARNVLTLVAESGGEPVQVDQVDKDCWRAAPATGPLTVLMEVHAFDTSVRTAYLDSERGFFNATSLCLRVAGQEHVPCTVDLMAPDANAVTGRWRVATSMRPVEAEPWGFGRYGCEHYDDLIDHPVEMGEFEIVEFVAGGRPHAFAMTGAGRFDADALAADVARICDAQVALFGELPCDRYLFLNNVTADGYGGLEHRYSSALASPRRAMPAPGGSGRSDDYVNFLGLVSHEYFHLWNVRRLMPAAVANSSLTAPAYFDDLWAYEGITSYYDDLGLLRAGVIDAPRYLDLLAKQMTRLERNPGRYRQSLAESSRLAWTKFYQQDASAPNAIVSYYNKGALVACALDLTLRRETDGACSLDDAMRTLWARYGRAMKPIPDAAIEQIAGEVSGLDLTDFFDAMIRTAGEVPLPELLADFGVTASVRPATGPEDTGGRPGSDSTGPRCWTGLSVKGQRQPRLTTVVDDSPAQQAGLAAGDRLVALDFEEATPGVIRVLEQRRAPGETVDVHAIRGDRLLHRQLSLAPPQDNTCTLRMDTGADEAVAHRRLAWLGASVAQVSEAG